MGQLSETKKRVLDNFEKKNEPWSFYDFENSLEIAMGNSYGNYQTAKMTIIQADRIGKWPKTVKNYVLTNFEANGNVPGEMTSILNRICESELSAEERRT